MKKLYFTLILLLFSICCFSQSRYIPDATKKVVFARDGGMCQCCGGSQSLEYDHIMPFSCGGTSVVSNIQLLCLKCNRSKSNSCYCKVHNRKVGVNCCDVIQRINLQLLQVNVLAQRRRGPDVKIGQKIRAVAVIYTNLF